MEDYKLLILMICLIALFGFIVSWQFKSFKGSMSEIELPELKMPDADLELFPEESTEYKEFVSPDGKLKLTYLADWTEIEGEATKAFEQELIEEAKSLFFAQKLKIKNRVFAFLLVRELNLGNDLEKIIEEIKKGVEEKGGGMEIANLEIKEGEASFEAQYKKDGNFIFSSKEKIFLGEDKCFLIMFMSLNNDWTGFEKEIKEIFDSVQITTMG